MFWKRLSIGPYTQEEPYIKKLHRYIKDQGYNLCGRDREIYLNNPQKVKSDKLKNNYQTTYKKVKEAI